MTSMVGRCWVSALLLLVACSNDGPQPDLRVGTPCPEVVMREVNDRWIELHLVPADAANWELATYMIGNLAAADALNEPRYLDYTIRWADELEYELNGDIETRNADNHAAGQVYLSLYERTPDPARIAEISKSLDNVIRSGQYDDWSWIDAQFMAMPAFAHLGELSGQARYTETMFNLYKDARDRRMLYDPSAGLWYRDDNYLFPDEKTPNGKKIFWSRGNGWVIAAHARTLDHLPADSPYRPELENVLRTMAAALAQAQRDDGMWSVSLADPLDHPGPEASGTAFFIYGIAWGINNGVLDPAVYTPVVERAWRGLVANAVRADGELGLVQGVGEKPGSSQPVTLLSTHDYGVGAFLLAGSEMIRLGIDLDCP